MHTQVGTTLPNLCGNQILTTYRAWIFAAGLVLGFCLLSGDKSNSQARDAFNGSRRVLAWLGRLSPQAAQYYEILSSFSDAIETYQAKLAREQQRSKVPLVERILSLDRSGGPQDPQVLTPTTMGAVDPSLPIPGETTPTSWSDILGTQVSITRARYKSSLNYY